MHSQAPSSDISHHKKSSSLNRRSLSIFSRRAPSPVSAVRPASMRTPPTHNRSMRWKPSKSKPEPKKAATILCLVPQAGAPPAPLPLERERPPSPNEEILNAIGRSQHPPDSNCSDTSSSLHLNQLYSPRAHSIKSKFSTSSLSPTTSRCGRTTPAPSPAFGSTIGVWMNGRTKWESEPPIPLVANVSDAFAPGSTPILAQPPAAKKHRRPRIQVIIPNDQRALPFQSLPCFTHNPNSIQSSTAVISTTELLSGISPPSRSQHLPIRTSVVSPLITQVPKPVRPFVAASSHLPSIPQQPERPMSNHKPQPSTSNSDEDSQVEDDCASSNYSIRSSRTSMDNDSPVEVEPISLHSRSGSVAFSIHSPVAAGVFDDPTSMAPGAFYPNSHSQDVKVCLKVPILEESPVVGWQHMPPPQGMKAYDILGLPRPQTSASTGRQASIKRRTSSSYGPPRRSQTPRGGSDIRERRLSKINTLSSIPPLPKSSPPTLFKNLPPTPPSPTLSEAENDLEAHLQLTANTDDDPFRWDDVVNRTLPTENDDLYGLSPPALPRKSSKRKSLESVVRPLQSRCPSTHIASQCRSNSRRCPPVTGEGFTRSWSKGRGLSLIVNIPESAKSMTSSFTFSPIPVPEFQDNSSRNISPEVAEGVILSILQSLECLDDLFATAVLNKGFYRVFKRHELSLIKRALRKMSPPAWEHREICPPDNEDHDLETPEQIEYTPTTYLQYYIRDMYVIAALKSLILDQCQSFLRPETAAALASNDQEISTRVNDTFWRIWSFCKLFGSGKGREDDVIAQMDWLKGGALVHQEACRSTIFSTDSYDVSSALATAPEYFAKGNQGGLTAEQLYDMTELWNCLGVLLQGFEGRTEQARKYGVFELTEIRGGDIDGEEFMLEEWYHYLLTLGLSTVLDLATPSKLPDTSLFILAAENGWVHWPAPSHGGSRKTFLKEAVSRVYENKIAASFSSQGQKEMLRQLSKQRIQKHVLEIRKRRETGVTREVRMSMERPMSNWENVMTRFGGPAPQPPYSSSSSTGGLPPIPRHPPPAMPLPAIPEMNQGVKAASPVPPPLESHPVFVQHPLQHQIHQSNSAENTAEKAIYRIVEMGFTADQARHALRMTDMGDGLRVDRAVELLLRA